MTRLALVLAIGGLSCGTRRPAAPAEVPTEGGGTAAAAADAGGAATARDEAGDRGTADDSTSPRATRRALGAGASFTCRLLSDGRVVCWGENYFGTLGDGTRSDRYAPVEVSGLTDAVDLVVDALGACATRTNGELVCWGLFGIGNDPLLTPRPMRGLEKLVQVALLQEELCGLDRGGGVVCSPRRDDPGSAGIRRVEGISGAVELAAGSLHACVRLADGVVLCWGANRYGQIGDGTTEDRDEPVPVAGIDDAEAIWVSGSSCWARRSSGEVWTWGFDPTKDALALDAGIPAPRPAPDPSGVLARAAQIGVRCVRTGEGDVHCRRAASDRGTELTAELVRVAFPRPVASLATGGMHACGLDDAGEVRCFGDNADGELGRGDAAQAVSRPTAVPGVSDAAEIVVGEWDACARLESGKVRCWAMSHGRDASSPPAVVEGISGARALHSGGQYACAVDRRDVTRCWGKSTWTQCVWWSEDNCQPEEWVRPRVVEGLAGIPGALEVVGDCVRLPSGIVRCVERYEGTRATDVAGVDDAAGLAGGAWLRCILRRGGAVGCLWPTYGGEVAPADDLPGVSDATAVAASRSHLCVVRASGAVSCTPFLGPAERCASASDPCATPAAIDGIGDAAGIAVGTGFSCVRHRGGTVSCWGAGEFGVLGDGTTRDFATPRPVPDLADVVQIAAREEHVCVRRAGGDVLCWGRILPGTAADDTPSVPVRMPCAGLDPCSGR